MSQQSQQPGSQQSGSQQPGSHQSGRRNWSLTVAIVGTLLAFTGPIPSFWDNVYKQAMVIRDIIFQSPPVQKNEIIIRKEVPVDTTP